MAGAPEWFGAGQRSLIVLGVADAAYTGVRAVPLGHAQGWAYPAHLVLLLWECDLAPRDRRPPDPSADSVLRTLWETWERVLLERSPTATRITTPAWEPEVERHLWRRFLEGVGYAPFAPGVWSTEVTSSG